MNFNHAWTNCNMPLFNLKPRCIRSARLPSLPLVSTSNRCLLDVVRTATNVFSCIKDWLALQYCRRATQRRRICLRRWGAIYFDVLHAAKVIAGVIAPVQFHDTPLCSCCLYLLFTVKKKIAKTTWTPIVLTHNALRHNAFAIMLFHKAKDVSFPLSFLLIFFTCWKQHGGQSNGCTLKYASAAGYVDWEVGLLWFAFPSLHRLKRASAKRNSKFLSSWQSKTSLSLHKNQCWWV